MTTICAMLDHIFLDTGYGQPSIHHHLAKHIIISLMGDLTVMFNEEKTLRCEGLIIDANVSHTVAGQDNRMLVFFVDDTSLLAQNINQYQLYGESFSVIEKITVARIRKAYDTCLLEGFAGGYLNFCGLVFHLLKLDSANSTITDDRVKWSLNYILKSVYIDNTIISKICAKVNLSQSRFSHLFKEQTGVSLNSYLALSKLCKAYQLLLVNGDITTAAMNAGFSTPSHFAASSKKFFGLSASEIARQGKIYFINS